MNLFLGIHPSKMEYEVQQSNLFQIQDLKKKGGGDTVYTEKVYLFFFYIKPYSLMKIHNVF